MELAFWQSALLTVSLIAAFATSLVTAGVLNDGLRKPTVGVILLMGVLLPGSSLVMLGIESIESGVQKKSDNVGVSQTEIVEHALAHCRKAAEQTRARVVATSGGEILGSPELNVDVLCPREWFDPDYDPEGGPDELP